MQGTYIIEVGYKKGLADPLGRGLVQDIRHWGARGVQKVAASQLYRLVGDLSPADRARIARDLLCDPIIQECRDGAAKMPAASGSRSASRGKTAVIDVWFKPGVTDVVGESVLKGIRDLGVPGISEARTGTRYRLWGAPQAEPARKIAWALLANPLVHDSFIHVD